MPIPHRKDFGSKHSKLHYRSLSVDLTVGMVCILVVILGTLLFFVYQRQSTILYREIESRADDYASKLSEVLAVPIWDFDDQQIANIGKGFLQNDLVRRILITNNQGDQIFFMEKSGEEAPLIGRGADITYDQQVIGHVEILLNTASYSREVSWLRNVLLIVLVFSIFVFFIASGMLLRVFLRKPLRVLEKGMGRIARGEFEHQNRSLSYTELAGIADRFSQMASRIKAREEALLDANRQLQEVNVRLRQRFRYEKLLAKLSARATSDVELPPFLDYSLRLLGETFDNAWIGLYAYSEQDDQLTLTCHWSSSKTFPAPSRLTAADGTPWAEMVANLRANALFKLDKPRRWDSENTDSTKGNIRPQSFLAFPLFVQQAFFGGILFGEKKASGHEDAKPVMETAVQIIVRFIESVQGRKLLQRSEERFREMAEMLPETIFEINADGIITYVNRSGLEQFGYGSEDLIKGLSAYDIFAQEELERLKKNIQNILKGKATRLKEYRARHRNGSLFPTMVSSSPIRKEDRIVGIRGFVIDISEKKDLEDRLRKASRMEAIGNLAAGVAHDLNNILSGLVGYPDLLLLDLPAESPMRSPIETIKSTGHKAAAVVQDLLTLARRNISELQVINLNDIIAEYLASPEFMQLKKRHGNVRLELQLDDDLMNTLASSHHLSKGLMNLVVNAIEAMPAGGRLLLKTNNRYVDRLINGYENIPEGEYVLLCVVDSGIGISSEDMQNIFEPFYTKKRLGRSGTGLGMSVVWATVKDHAGFVDVKSREGHGTRFDLYFPVTRQKIAPKPSQIPVDDYLGSERILVVDDVPEQRKIAADMLGRLGYDVQTVSDGETAVELIAQQPIDLVILDMVMEPGIDGLETYQQILSRVPNQKAIIASGFAENDRVRATLKLGAYSYLKKPYTLEKLGLAVREALDHLATADLANPSDL